MSMTVVSPNDRTLGAVYVALGSALSFFASSIYLPWLESIVGDDQLFASSIILVTSIGLISAAVLYAFRPLLFFDILHSTRAYGRVFKNQDFRKHISQIETYNETWMDKTWDSIDDICRYTVSVASEEKQVQDIIVTNKANFVTGLTLILTVVRISALLPTEISQMLLFLGILVII